jgi:hypothetical protein
MTTTTYSSVGRVFTAGVSHTRVILGRSASTPAGSHGRQRIPWSIPRSQAYYWRRSWQDDERETLANLETGDVKRFPSGRDAIRWLLSEDDS